MELLDLPNEILEDILYLVDGVTLVHVGRTCHRLHSVVEIVINHDEYWRCTSHRDLEKSILDDLLLNNRKDNYELFWKKLFVRFHLNQRIPCWDHLNTTLDAKSGWQNIGIKINGEYVYMVHRGHYVSYWDAIQGVVITDSHIQTSNTGNLTATILPKLHLIYYGDDEPVLVSVANQWIFFNRSRDEKWLKSVHSDMITDISVFEDKIVSCSSRQIVAGIFFLDQKGKPSYRQICTMRRHVGHVLAVALWRNKVVSASLDGCLLLWDIYAAKDATVIKTDMEHFVRSIIFRDPIVILLYADVPYIEVLKTDQTESSSYNVLEALHGSPTMIVLKGTFLAIALNTGAIYLYHIKATKDLLCLNLQQYLAKLKFSDTLLSLDIGDDGEGPVVAIVTNKNHAEVVRWFPCEN